MTVQKDQGIQALVQRLRLAERGWIIVDHWAADLCAIGIAHKDDPARLAYISNYEKPAERFYVECEVPRDSTQSDFRTARVLDDVGYPDLVRLLEEHLRRS